MTHLYQAMLTHFAATPHQIQHLTKVHGFARWIGLTERLDAPTQQILELAALTHDIGIKPALEKYGSASGKYQEQEGPPVAEALLKRLGYPPQVIDRVSYLIGHHHTYTNIDGPDYQILIEADFLVNMFEGNMSKDAIKETLEKVFRTQTGKAYCRTMYGVD